MLPERVEIDPSGESLFLNEDEVLDTELIHLCWLVEEELDDDQILDYVRILLEDVLQCSQGKFRQHFALNHATWQHRAVALAKVKGVEIV